MSRKTQKEEKLLKSKNGIIDDEYILFKYYKNFMQAALLESGNIPDNEKEYLLNRFDDTNDFVEVVYRIKYNILERPKCPICGKDIPFIRRQYNEYCSRVCANKNPNLINKRKATCLERYGTEVPTKNKDIAKKASETWKNKTQEELDARHEKTKKTCLERYGVEHVMYVDEFRYKLSQVLLNRTEEEKQITKEKIQQAWKNKTQEEIDEIIEKIKKTCLERYGAENVMDLDFIREKMKQTWKNKTQEELDARHEKTKKTCLERYGAENVMDLDFIREKIKKTCLERYGVDNVLKLEKFRKIRSSLDNVEIGRKASETILEKYGSYINLEKAKQTNLERYGHESYSKTDMFKQRMSEVAASEEFQKKRSTTLRNNNTFNTSKPEETVYSLLLQVFDENDIIRQYKSKEYPYACDFYIKSINTYIEYNGSQYHHGHKFDKNNEDDLIELERLYNKSRQLKESKHNDKRNQYDVMIYVWTKLDIDKYNTAKENNLNWFAFYNIKECEEWLNLITDVSILS